METMLDVKKLITGFLILALGASAAMWILSNANGTPGASSGTLAMETSPSSLTSNNAFLSANVAPQDVADLLASQPLSSSTEAALEQPGNLTGTLGNSLLNGLVAANPDGIQTDANNNQEINQSDDGAILSELQNNPATSNISIPDWDTEAANIPIHAVTATSETNVTDYSNALDTIFNNSFLQNGIQNMVSDTSGADPANISYVQSAVAGALNNVASLETPTNLRDFQKSFIKVLVYEKDSLSLVENSSTDPVKTSLILQGEEAKYNLALSDFENQFEKAQSLNGFSLGGKSDNGSKTPAFAFLETFFAIPTAHAVFGVGDVVIDPAVLARMILNYAYDVALQSPRMHLFPSCKTRFLLGLRAMGHQCL